MSNEKAKGPDHSTRSTNKKLPGIVKPGANPNAAPKVKIIKGPAPSPTRAPQA